ncbi:MAG: ribosome recycling factor [Patescibacteria group bacterium]|nr:ribosome recycling factor [Patescibacteria group bacterium]
MQLKNGKTKLSDIVSRLNSDLSKIRTGRATPDILDSVKVNVYDSMMPIKHIANVSVPDAKTIVIQPWDTANTQAVEKAIISSDLNLSPVVDGDIVRISVPQLTQELREGLVKEVKAMVEQAKVSVRSIRHEMRNELEDLKSSGGISEDDIKRQKDGVEQEVRKIVVELDEISKTKEQELMTI